MLEATGGASVLAYKDEYDCRQNFQGPRIRNHLAVDVGVVLDEPIPSIFFDLKPDSLGEFFHDD